MGRTSERLTSGFVQKVREPGKYVDGMGLFLRVTKSGSKDWQLRYRSRGRERYMGLGNAKLVSLKDARLKTVEARRLILEGVDPISAREAA